jgi:hypothetical protein
MTKIIMVMAVVLFTSASAFADGPSNPGCKDVDLSKMQPKADVQAGTVQPATDKGGSSVNGNGH